VRRMTWRASSMTHEALPRQERRWMILARLARLRLHEASGTTDGGVGIGVAGGQSNACAGKANLKICAVRALDEFRR